MSLSAAQIKLLTAPLSSDKVRKNARGYDYVEGWHAIAEANRIFGFDKWTRETIELRQVSERERKVGKDKRDGWSVSYVARVRVTVDGLAREGVGAGHGIDVDLGLAHESAVKEAETDAMKRALMTFGNPFGLALYDKDRTNVSDGNGEAKTRFIEETKTYIAAAVDWPMLAEWWNSEAQKQERRDFELDSIDVNTLKQLVMVRIEFLKPKGKAA